MRPPVQAGARLILLADEDRDIVNLLQYILEAEGFVTQTARDGVELLETAGEVQPDLILMDVMLPRVDGIAACHKIRRHGLLWRTPVVLLTDLSEESLEVEALDAGADDFLYKPIVPRLLMSRVRALLRRASAYTESGFLPQILRVSDLEINRNDYLVRRLVDPPELIKLTRRSFELLHYLASHPGRVYTRQELLNDVWGSHVIVMDRTVDVHVSKLREQIGSSYIETVKGVGYRFRS
ncbi:MAG TPA: response regulator transcription factor [Rhodothermales bacterium]|nr:response regulator transcription factor [Rhodothermales bacterium]